MRCREQRVPQQYVFIIPVSTSPLGAPWACRILHTFAASPVWLLTPKLLCSLASNCLSELLGAAKQVMDCGMGSETLCHEMKYLLCSSGHYSSSVHCTICKYLVLLLYSADQMPKTIGWAASGSNFSSAARCDTVQRPNNSTLRSTRTLRER